MLLVGGIGFVVERSRAICAIVLTHVARDGRRASRRGINYTFILSVDYNRKQSVVYLDGEAWLRIGI
ncbi:MAG: hypothetical protein HW389_3490 [Bacteroidetes bacterium]|nr:hypothetical protein [Bacteroidota bacterium]MBM2840960.1 hypothetical protein [Bacteroidota bacterium]